MNKSISYAKTASQQVAPRTVPVYAPGRVEAREKVRARAARSQNVIPRWFIFFILAALSFVFCLALNVKSQAEFGLQQQKQNSFQVEIEQLKNDNTALTNEIQQLQTDPSTIERAARERANMVRSNEIVLVSTR